MLRFQKTIYSHRGSDRDQITNPWMRLVAVNIICGDIVGISFTVQWQCFLLHWLLHQQVQIGYPDTDRHFIFTSATIVLYLACRKIHISASNGVLPQRQSNTLLLKQADLQQTLNSGFWLCDVVLWLHSLIPTSEQCCSEKCLDNYESSLQLFKLFHEATYLCI